MSKKRSFDSAMELQAMKAGLLPNPVFPENKEVFIHSNGHLGHDGDAYLPSSTLAWREPPPKVNNTVPVYQLVMADIMSRAEMGRNKYGTYLQAGNGRNALKDAYEEVLDLANYLRQKLEEEKNG